MGKWRDGKIHYERDTSDAMHNLHSKEWLATDVLWDYFIKNECVHTYYPGYLKNDLEYSCYEEDGELYAQSYEPGGIDLRNLDYMNFDVALALGKFKRIYDKDIERLLRLYFVN